MTTLLTILLIVIGVVLCAVVLLQSNRAAGLGAVGGDVVTGHIHLGQGGMDTVIGDAHTQLPDVHGVTETVGEHSGGLGTVRVQRFAVLVEDL